ncbi:hypothetical protein [Domibacillus mangrovi]|uniref:Uncharacterized protein n=1 Tax=Domibacillus mangrovi TaxID=1714354 RepID=A0A1Q5P476_9BACI|nr:hypothetical protein [Domibacillus mangrovi]OKL37007.1 hypothetical protein BLL40_05290 [Domibacillus mangrovi]
MEIINEQVEMTEKQKEDLQKYNLVGSFMQDLSWDDELNHLNLRDARRIAEYIADASMEGLKEGINQTMAKLAPQKAKKTLTADQQFHQMQTQNIQEEMEAKIRAVDKPASPL